MWRKVNSERSQGAAGSASLHHTLVGITLDSMADTDTQMLKGVLPMVVLARLDANEAYGYDLVASLAVGGLAVSTGTVYPLLARLETEGKITSRLVASPQGPARKYYRTTTAGRDYLVDQSIRWHELTRAITTLLEEP